MEKSKFTQLSLFPEPVTHTTASPGNLSRFPKKLLKGIPLVFYARGSFYGAVPRYQPFYNGVRAMYEAGGYQTIAGGGYNFWYWNGAVMKTWKLRIVH